MSWASYKLNLWLKLAAGLLVVLLINQLAHRYRMRLDMTEENRYSISGATKNLLGRLDDPVYVEVYLAGELPANFTRFQKAIRETLEEFAIYADGQVEYKFIDPSQAESARARNQFYQGLIRKGLQPSNLNITREGQQSQLIVFPGAVMSYRGKELGVNLLKGNRTADIEEILNQSIEGLEYELATGISQLTQTSKKRVGLIIGHGELDSLELAGFTNAVLSKYDLFRINLPERSTPLTGYDAIVVPKPTRAFTEQEKYYLDQYLMKGGKLMFFLDALRVNIDSLSGEGMVAVPYEHNLSDLLFRYGVRINQNYAVDLNCGTFPIVAGNVGNQPQINLLPWPYFPVISNFGDHPVVKNLDAVRMMFVSTIDTVKATGITKTPLLLTSANSKVLGSPVQVGFNDLRAELIPEKFRSGPQPLGYLLEGKFTSLYRNRFLPAGADKASYQEEGLPSKVVVIADGDFIRNDFDPRDGNPLPMGVDPYSKTTYGNEALVMNLLAYLMDEDGLIQTRAKEFKIRPLDRAKVKSERVKWQVINLVSPVVVLILFGILKAYLRKKKNQG